MRRLWQMRRSPEIWLLVSNLLSRLLGFVVSLLVSRIAGVQALGVYSGLLITAASPTTPLSAVMANNATILSARHHGRVRLRAVLRAQLPVWLLALLCSVLGCAVMLVASGLLNSTLLPWAMVLWVMAGLVVGQLLTHVVVGIFHGSNLSIRASVVSSLTAVIALMSAYPVLRHWGLQGILVQAMLVALVPGLLLGWLGWREATPASPELSDVDLRSESRAQFRRAWPNMVATVVNNGTNWVACIYLAERFHGHAGLGLVAISLQWMALMQLPVSSWGGRVMRALSLGHDVGPTALRQEIGRQWRRCVWVSLVGGAAVLAVAPWVADLYRVDRATLFWMLAINAMATVLAGINVVYERVFFCLGTQGPWLWFSTLAYAIQLLATWLLIPHAIYAVAVGNLMASVVVVVGVTWYLWRRGYVGGRWR
ncbi:lipopolysaccharide biosynthesis protein [Aquabacterium sp.]|uniref:lipopolysaccharide biosynthesis protein n=1 Tax=Aquabacterium sp. TaxID=1872578 RepID=UPI0027B95345|nr:hypothetical protein [Aquabacterium sp.]